ncbi:MAG: heavy metal response regulator transcription factor [Micropepsaceae bacterium]
MKFLVVEDDLKTRDFLTKGLVEQGYFVDAAANGADAMGFLALNKYDLIILDVMMPVRDGWWTLSELRRNKCETPVIMLTARESVESRVQGLTLGADDYLVKPFAFSELMARIKAIMRRSGQIKPEVLQIEDLELDPRRHEVKRGADKIELTAKEFLLLELLLRHNGEVLSRTFISEQVWDVRFDTDSNVVDVNIRRLRAKVDDPYPRKLIHTIRGRGYAVR